MSDLDKALADIFAIRSQIAAGTAFRGYGPAAVAVTGGLALAHRPRSIRLARRSDRPSLEILRRLGRGRVVSGA